MRCWVKHCLNEPTHWIMVLLFLDGLDPSFHSPLAVYPGGAVCGKHASATHVPRDQVLTREAWEWIDGMWRMVTSKLGSGRSIMKPYTRIDFDWINQNVDP